MEILQKLNTLKEKLKLVQEVLKALHDSKVPGDHLQELVTNATSADLKTAGTSLPVDARASVSMPSAAALGPFSVPICIAQSVLELGVLCSADLSRGP